MASHPWLSTMKGAVTVHSLYKWAAGFQAALGAYLFCIALTATTTCAYHNCSFDTPQEDECGNKLLSFAALIFSILPASEVFWWFEYGEMLVKAQRAWMSTFDAVADCIQYAFMAAGAADSVVVELMDNGGGSSGASFEQPHIPCSSWVTWFGVWGVVLWLAALASSGSQPCDSPWAPLLGLFTTRSALVWAGTLLLAVFMYKIYVCVNRRRPSWCNCLCQWQQWRCCRYVRSFCQCARTRTRTRTHSRSDLNLRLVHGAQDAASSTHRGRAWYKPNCVLFCIAASSAVTVAVTMAMWRAHECMAGGSVYANATTANLAQLSNSCTVVNFDNAGTRMTDTCTVSCTSHPGSLAVKGNFVAASVAALMLGCIRVWAFWKRGRMSRFSLYVEHVLEPKASSKEIGRAMLGEARRVEQLTSELVDLVCVQQRGVVAEQEQQARGCCSSSWLTEQIKRKSTCVLSRLFDQHVRAQAGGEAADMRVVASRLCLRDLLVITTVGAVVVLDPEWLAGVVSSLQGHTTYHPVPNPNQLHTTDWDRVWRQYPARMRPTLLTLLHGMDMVFKACDVARGAGAPHHLDSHGYSIVPAMLPTTACGGDCVERFDTIAGHGTTKLPAASIHVTMDHIPHYFFARFHACVQALVSPHDSHLWRNGGIYTAHAAAAGLARKVMVWQPALEKPTIKVLLHCTNMGTSAVQFQLSFVHCLHHRLSSLAHAHTNFCLRCFAAWRLWLRVFSARPLPTLLLRVLAVTAPECHSA